MWGEVPMTDVGEIDLTFDVAAFPYQIDFQALKRELRANGMSIMRSGNTDKFSVAEMTEKGHSTLHIFGTCLYQAEKDMHTGGRYKDIVREVRAAITAIPPEERERIERVAQISKYRMEYDDI